MALEFMYGMIRCSRRLQWAALWRARRAFLIDKIAPPADSLPNREPRSTIIQPLQGLELGSATV